VNIIEELLRRKSSGSALENREYGRRDPLLTMRTLYPQKLAVTSPTSGGRLVGIDRSQTEATEFTLVPSVYSDIGLGSVPFVRRHWTDPFRR
jgi:hypothetical protein